jgi:D-serine deaminase-like pyridoxal phosphate-dependent protein
MMTVLSHAAGVGSCAEETKAVLHAILLELERQNAELETLREAIASLGSSTVPRTPDRASISERRAG